MSTITRTAVTLTHAEAAALTRILNDYSRYNWDHARKTHSAAIRTAAEQNATAARDLEADIVRRMFEAAQ